MQNTTLEQSLVAWYEHTKEKNIKHFLHSCICTKTSSMVRDLDLLTFIIILELFHNKIKVDNYNLKRYVAIMAVLVKSGSKLNDLYKIMKIFIQKENLNKMSILSKFLDIESFIEKVENIMLSKKLDKEDQLKISTFIIHKIQKSKNLLYFLEIGFRFNLLLSVISSDKKTFEEAIKVCEGIKFNPYEIKSLESLKPIELLNNDNLEFVVKMIKTKNIKIEEAVKAYEKSHISFVFQPESFQRKYL